MIRERDQRVRHALREAEVPEPGQAEERGWRVVREAFAEREPVARRPSNAQRTILGVIAAGLVAAFALTPAGASVREWIADAIDVGEEDAKTVLGALPAEGAVLTESGDGVWILNADGSRRRLGDYRHATWSPNGLFVGASRGRVLSALTPQGEVRWEITAPGPVTSIDWSSDEGFRVAYLSGGELRVVAGDGTGDAALAGSVGSAAIAWRPESDPARARHQLAYVDADNRVTLIDTDTRRALWRSAPVAAAVESLQWSASGHRLLVEAEGFALVLAGDGAAVLKGPLGAGASEAAIAPNGRQVALVMPSRRGGAELVVTTTRPGGSERVIYPIGPAATGSRFGAPAFSPDSEWILLPWPQADQWLFIRIADRRVVAVADVSRQLDADRRGDSSFPRVAGWCC